MTRVTVLLADDHKLVVDALAALLKDSFELVGTVHDGRALVEEATRLRPEVIVTDVFMPLLNGLDAARQIKARRIDSKIVFLSVHTDAKLAAEAFRAGATAFVSKESAGEELINAIRDASQDRPYITPLVAKDMINVFIDTKNGEIPPDPQLTPRQREVLQLIAEGKTMKEIATILQISSRTAETHKYEAMESLGAANTAELIRWAVKLQIVSTK